MNLLKYKSSFLYGALFLIAVSAGAYLNLGLKFIIGDALVRSFHAYQVFYGSVPKLSAIGFVWPPIQTLAQLPIALISPLNTSGIVGNIVSSIFLVFTIYFLNNIAKFFKVNTFLRITTILLFITNPMIFFYGINGMSEMMGICFLMMALYYFMKHIETEAIPPIVIAGASVSLAIMTRWEMAIVIPVLVPLFLLLSFVKKTYSKRKSESSIILFLFPVLATIFLWVLISWMITGSPFPGAEQIDNNLGDGTTQIQAVASASELFIMALKKVAVLSPLFPILAALTLWQTDKKKRLYVITVFGLGLSVLTSQIALYTLGKTVGELRYFISVIPMTYILLLSLAEKIQQQKKKIIKRLIISGTIGLMALSSVVTAYGMASKEFNNQEYLFINALLAGHNNSPYYNYEDEETIANYITDNIHSRGILIDDTVGFSIIYFTKQSKLFIQQVDNDFKGVLNNPVEHNISHILVSRPNADGDLINSTFPNLFESGAEFVTLEKDFGDWKLYRLGRTAVTEPSTVQPVLTATPSSILTTDNRQPTTSPIPTPTADNRPPTTIVCTHIVTAGESLWSIAETIYGNGEEYTKLQALNPQINPEESHLEINQSLTIPCK